MPHLRRIPRASSRDRTRGSAMIFSKVCDISRIPLTPLIRRRVSPVIFAFPSPLCRGQDTRKKRMNLYFLNRRVSVVPSAYYRGHRCIYPRPPVVAAVRASLRESCPCGLPERKHCYRPSRHRDGNVAALYRVPRILRLRLSACISRGGCSKLSYPTEITTSRYR